MKTNTIHINEADFVKSNLMHSNMNIDCILKTYGVNGILVDIFKISKRTKISTQECLSVMLGKIACIGEEWNFKQMDIDNWKYVFNPKTKYTTYILKQFKQTDPKLLLKRNKEYIKYLKNGDIKLKVAKTYTFNGSNTSEFYDRQNLRSAEEIKLLEPLDGESIINCYSNEENWHWNVWLLETKEDYILYEENTCD